MDVERPSNLLRGQHGTTLVELSVTLTLFAVIMLATVSLWAKVQEVFVVGSDLAEVQQNARAALDFMAREIRAVGRDVTGCAFDFARGASLDCAAAKVAACQLALGGNYDVSNGLPGGGPGCTGLAAIPYREVSATSIRIRSDRNDNGRIAGMGNAILAGADADRAEEDVTYALTTGTPCPTGVSQCITRNDGSGRVALLAVDVGGFRLTYYPRTGFGPCAGAGSPLVIPDPCPSYTLPLASQEAADDIARIRVEVTALGMAGGRPVSRALTTDIVLKNRR